MTIHELRREQRILRPFIGYSGYRMPYFSPGLPLDQINPISQRSGARGVVPSAHTPLTSAGEAELARLAAAGGVRPGLRIAVALQALASPIPVHIGGSGSNHLRGSAHAS